MKKIKVGIIFGGKSAEHEISLQSAKNIFESIDRNKYEPILIGIDKSGSWFLINKTKLIEIDRKTGQNITLIPHGDGKVINLNTHKTIKLIDVAFPILHGPFGEDGTIQGLIKIANIPFVGASILGSAIGMDKDVMKRLLRDAKIPIAKFLTIKIGETISYQEIVKKLGSPFFVKPANMGSSVGISKVENQNDFKKSIHEAFAYDQKILIEENIIGREIECSILGNSKPIASIIGEIIPHHNFYSYKAKYLDKQGATLQIPAKLSKNITKRIQGLAIKTFKTLECEGMARVDFFLKKNGSVIVNEINTIPGFTPISMYPKLWATSGISPARLIDHLIQLALERFKNEQKLKNFVKIHP